MTMYHLRDAETRDLDACLQLRRAAEADFARRGIDQWTDPEAGNKAIRKWINLGSMFVVTDPDAEVIACCALNGPDQDFWTPEEMREPAMYAYKMIIRPDHRGIGLGDILLNFRGARAASLGAEWLRVDCWRTNSGLHRYILSRGFRHIATREAPGRWSGWLAQRPASMQIPLPASCRTVVVDETNPITTPGFR